KPECGGPDAWYEGADVSLPARQECTPGLSQKANYSQKNCEEGQNKKQLRLASVYPFWVAEICELHESSSSLTQTRLTNQSIVVQKIGRSLASSGPVAWNSPYEISEQAHLSRRSRCADGTRYSLLRSSQRFCSRLSVPSPWLRQE